MQRKHKDKTAKGKKKMRLSQFKNSLMVKMILSNSLLIILVAILLTGISTYQSRDAITVEIEKQLHYQLESVSRSILTEQENITKEITLMSHMNNIRKGVLLENDYTVKQFLQEYIEQQNHLENAYILDANGKVMYDVLNSKGKDLSDQDYFQASLKGDVYMSQVKESPFTGNKVQVVSSPIKDRNNQVIGVLAACNKFEVYKKMLDQVELLDGSTAYLLNKEGIILYHTNTSYVGQHVTAFNIPELNDHVEAMANGKTDKLIYNFEGITKLNMYMPIGDMSLSINASQHVYLAPVKDMQNNLFLYASIFTLIGLLAGGYNSVRMVRKITRMKKAIRTAAAGDLTVTLDEGKMKKCWEVKKCNKADCPAYQSDNLKCWDMPDTLCDGEMQEGIISKIDKCTKCNVYEMSEGDELQQISRSINTMVSSLKEMLTNIKKVSLDLSASSQELSTASEESSVAAEEIAKNMSAMTDGVETQVTNVSETNQLVEQMDQKLSQSSSATQQMAEKAYNVQETSIREQKVITNTIDHMHSIKLSSEQTVKVMEALNTQSDEIGSINEVITQLAEQTNLLALNAAIEAARAGEQGKGFAVVAEEIRKLAFQSGESAQGIQKLIMEIQSEIATANRLILEENEKVDKGIQSVKESEQAFNTINENIEEVGQYIQDVVTLIEETKGSSTKVSQAVGNIVEVVTESAAGAEQVTATTEEQTSTSEEIAKSADQLAHMADALLENISSFKVND
ncbi:hypothetical protein HZI73_02080 [Vallitalea pronyensis]|uniref:Methyl-accepting chemotaxis protein n=1 Tax=Vallitalea pronyensis TaxID=1348613 RepID=A0A8J8SFD6_9FIRM|nr:methyl-accepting chemotaxis protein [Vallitalea pronyensis]QUI21148.1 hypothetical protein HZI73_02080 [Vallitalea pronyensis]